MAASIKELGKLYGENLSLKFFSISCKDLLVKLPLLNQGQPILQHNDLLVEFKSLNPGARVDLHPDHTHSIVSILLIPPQQLQVNFVSFLPTLQHRCHSLNLLQLLLIENSWSHNSKQCVLGNALISLFQAFLRLGLACLLHQLHDLLWDYAFIICCEYDLRLSCCHCDYFSDF